MNGDEHKLIAETREEVKEIFILLRGDDSGQLGLIQQVRFMWKAFWLWPLCTLSGIGGIIGTLIAQRIFK